MQTYGIYVIKWKMDQFICLLVVLVENTNGCLLS
jgi:hypothetical protein